ncbi:MAG: Ig-like domain-containing protein [Oscillospiraceae bacterium]|nr:Ig-like domain-containing protein [Oscillospiraceae bacterium]
MKNIFKKALSFFLAVIMTVGMFPVTAMAEEQYVYFSISLDDKFLEGSDGTVMAHVPVAVSELENINLSDYGLSEYAIDKNGDGKEDITALHLDLYAHDKYCERNGKEIAEQVEGAPGSLYFNSFWSGHDCNLNYYVNGEYPLNAELSEQWGYSVGATADVIAVNPGDFVDIIMMNSWNFCWDSFGGFHYFIDGNGSISHEFKANAGEEISFDIGRAYGNLMMGGATELVPETNGATFYYSNDKTDMLSGGGNSVFDDDCDGTVSVTFPEAGTWYVWVPGMYGMEYPDEIVSGPAFAEVTVTGEAEPEITLSLDKTALSITEGKTAEITATVVPEEKASEIEWSSSDESVATVGNGVVTAVSKGEATVTAKIGDVSAECQVTVTELALYLSELSFSETATGEFFEMSPELGNKIFGYDVKVQDSINRIFIKAKLSGDAPEGSAITAKFIETKGTEQIINVKSGNAKGVLLTRALNKGTVGNTVTLEVGVEGDIQTYTIELKRTPSLTGLSAADLNGNAISFNEKFEVNTTEYTASTGEEKIAITGIPYDESYTITYNGSENNVVSLSEGENIIAVTAKNAEGFEKTYNLKITKLARAKITFSVNPKNALVYISDKFKQGVPANENGEFELLEGETYTYNVTAFGYIGKTAEYVPAGDAFVMVNLEKAPATSFKEYDSSWPFFGLNNNNNMVIDRPTPTVKEETALYWANKIGTGYDYGATGVPILVDDYLYCYAGKTIMKIDKISGEIIQTGKMTGGSSAYAICSLTYAEGLIFVGLNNGTVQAFNAETLESVWLYRDPLKGQPNAQITYSDGYVYTGFWNSEDGEAAYVALSITDENPEETDEVKIATWRHIQKGGFYWAGAYIEGDYLYIGTDDGEDGYQTGYAHLLSINKHTGKVVNDVTMPNVGDIRSSINQTGGKLYFTSKGGYFYEAEYNPKTGDIGNLRFIELQNGSNGVPMSTSTPTVYNGRAYIGVSGKGQFSAYSGHNITVIDIPSWSIAYSVPTQGYPQTTGTLTTYYEKTDGYVYVYFFDNYTPGKLRVLADKPGMTEPLKTIEETTNGKTYEVGYSVFEPTGKLAQYCICTPIIDEDGTLYFKNDSANLFAVGSAVEYIEVTKNPDKMSYKPGETFDPTGMEVTAYYYNGTERDITKYVTWSAEPLTEEDENFMIVFENVGGDEKPFDTIELSISSGFIELVPEKEPTKTKIRLNDTVKFDNTIDTPETFFVKDPKGGVFYVGILSDMEYDEFELHTNGYLKGQLIDFDPEKYRSIGETYCVYNSLTGEIAENVLSSGAGIRPDNKAEGMTYEKAVKLAEHLNDENKVTYYKVKCEQNVYVAKITVPENYSTAYKSGTYKITAEKDGIKYSSAENKIVTDVSIFEYEYLKWSASDKDHFAEVLSENARGYSDYLSDKYGYGDEEYAPPLWEKPTVVSTTAFRAVAGKKMVLACGEGVKITIPEISTMQRGINFIYKNTVGELDKEKKTTVYSLNFYGKQPVQSDFIIEWKLGVNAFQLRESFKIRVEEEDIITYYILKDGKYFDEFTVDYMTDDLNEDITLTLENEGGTTLGNYTITTKKPADADSADDSEEINPNTGAPIF